MTAFTIAYRLTVYDRGTGGNETTALVPRSGHSDPFQISTLGGLSGFQPYMGIPKGTKSNVTLPQAKLVAGRFTVDVIDQRLTQGGSNFARWATAFLSDQQSRLWLYGRKVFIEESLDNGSTWAAFFVGRISNITTTSGLNYTLEISDSFQDLQRTIFDRFPDGVTYAVPERLLPPGVSAPVLSMPVYLSAALGKVKRIDPGMKAAYIEITQPSRFGSALPWNRLSPEFTNIVAPLAYQAVDILGVTIQIPEFPSNNPNKNTQVQLYHRNADDSLGAGLGSFVLYEYFSDTDSDGFPYITAFIIYEDFANPSHTSVSSLTVEQDVLISMTNPKQPLYLNNVHPLDVVSDICAGKYTLPADASGNRVAIGLDTTGLATLKANTPRILPGVFKIESTMTIQQFLELYVCQPYGLGYITRPKSGSNPTCELHFFDLALPTDLTGLPTIGQDDLDASSAPQWTATAPIKSFSYNYYSDLQDPQSGLDPKARYPKSLSVKNLVQDLAIADTYLPASTLNIDANGVRGGIAVVTGSVTATGPQYDQKIEPYAFTLSSAIANRWVVNGSTALALKCRRTSTITGLNVGDWCFVSVDKAPNQATNQRGGTRVMQVVGKSEQGLTVNVSLADGALNVVAPAPILGAFTETTASLGATCQLPITLHASGACTFQVLSAPLHASQPLDTDTRWRTVGTLPVNNTTVIGYAQNLYQGTTVYARARTEYLFSGSALPSLWVTASAGVDIAFIDPPTNLTLARISTSSADLSWTCASSTSFVEVLLSSGTGSLQQIAILQPSSSFYSIPSLASYPTQSHTVGVRHRDGFGSVSTMISASFVATGSLDLFLAPPFLDVFIGGDALIDTSAQPLSNGNTVNTGVVLAVFASKQSATINVQRSDNNGLSYGDVGQILSCDLAGSPFIDQLPNDGLERLYRAQEKYPGFDDSDYCAPASATPTIIPTNIDFAGKPWLFNQSVPLSLVMVVSAETDTAINVSSSINLDPAGLVTPTVSVLSYQGLVSAPFPVGAGEWRMTKPLSGSGRVIFQNSATGRLSDQDAVDIQSQAVLDTGSFLRLNVRQVSSSAASVTVSASAINPHGYPISIYGDNYFNLTGSNLAPGVFTFSRPSSSVGSVVFHVTSSTAGTVEDTETFYVSAQANQAPLTVQGVVTGSSTSSVAGYFTITDPYTTFGAISGLTVNFASQSGAGFTASVGTPTNANAVYTVPFLCTRGFYTNGANTSYLTCAVSKSSATSESDTITVLENVSGLGHLVAKLDVTAESANTVTISGSAYDPLERAVAPTMTLTLTPSVPFTGTNPWVVNRPLSSSVQAQVLATKPNRVEDVAYATVTSNVTAVTNNDFLTLVLTSYPPYNDGTHAYYSSSVINPRGVPVHIYPIFSDTTQGASAIGDFNAGGSVTFIRPDSGVAAFSYGVSSSVAGVIPDTHTIYIGSAGVYSLNVNAHPTATDATSVTYDVVVSDPNTPAATGLTGVSLTVTGSGNTGMTTTLNSTTANQGATVYNYTVLRPNLGTGTGRVTWGASKAGYITETDSADVPEASVLSLGINAQTITSDATSQTIAVTGSCFIGGTAPTIAIIGNPASLSTSRSSTTSVTSTTSTTTEVWVITRPSSLPASITFEASRTGQTSQHIDYAILPQTATSGGGGSSGISGFYVSSFSWVSNTITLTWLGSPPSGGSFTLKVAGTTSLTDFAETYTSVSSPYTFDASGVGTMGKSGAWESISFNFTLFALTSTSTVTDTATVTSTQPGVPTL